MKANVMQAVYEKIFFLINWALHIPQFKDLAFSDQAHLLLSGKYH